MPESKFKVGGVWVMKERRKRRSLGRRRKKRKRRKKRRRKKEGNLKTYINKNIINKGYSFILKRTTLY